jgi:hypothetical protein
MRIHGDKPKDRPPAPEYTGWIRMKDRCRNPKSEDFKRYGGRGISVFAGWLHDYPAFLSHVGRKPTPKHTLDRIDNNGNYEPGNVRWLLQRLQSRNRRDNHLLTMGGVTRSVAEWSEVTGISSPTILYRIRRGISTIDALTIPAGKGGTRVVDRRAEALP